ncbi:MAG TPA: A24 family peptidase [Acidimicrobiia bacterium]|jgi:leader peptidase (prepilin peptidase)/N-methyltransferase|nr:A24 family peptidase [Acidimicrobiia bacterium]
MILVAIVAAVVGAGLGWFGAEFATRVLHERDEDLGPMPGWVRPVNAIAVGALCLAVPFVIDNGWVVPAYVWFVALTMALVVTDIHSQLIPNRINYPGTGFGAALLLGGALISGDLGDFGRGLAGVAIFYVLTMILLIVGRGRSFGGGDVKLSVVLGLFTAFLGWDQFATGVVMGFLIGGFAAMLLLLVRSRGLRDHFAFGPPMVFGAYVGIVWGEALVNWYLN